MAQAKKEKKKTLKDYKDSFVTVYPTQKNTFHEHHKELSLDPVAAENLKKKGMVGDEDFEESEDKDSDEPAA